MLEINILSLLYTGVVALGLISAQAALTKKNFMLTVSSPASLTATGYSREVIEALFLNDLQRVFRTRSIITAPSIHSVSERNIVEAFADMLHMGELSLTMQQALGNTPYRVWANFITEGGKTHALVFGSSARGDFQRVVTTSKSDPRLLVRNAAHAAIRAIDPYFMALHDFELGQNLAGVEAMVDEELARQRTPLTAQQRAAFHNLKGLVRLENDDKQGAMAAFDTAIGVDPQFAIARVNRAYTLVALDRHPEAIATAQEVLTSAPEDRPDQVMVAARTVIAISKWAHGDHAGAETYFAIAVRESPKALIPLIYWSRMLSDTGRPDASVAKLLAARTVEKGTEDMFAEIAMLYYWVGEEDQVQPVIRRVSRRQARGLDQADNPDPTPPVPAAPASSGAPIKQ